MTLLAAAVVPRAWTRNRARRPEGPVDTPLATQQRAIRQAKGRHSDAPARGGRTPASAHARSRKRRRRDGDDQRRDERHDGDDRRAVQAEGREHGGDQQRTDRVPEPAAHREDAHVGGDPAARREARPAGALGMISGHAGAADDGRHERKRITGHQADGGDPEGREQEAEGQQPARLAPVAVGAGQRLHAGRRQAGGEREHAYRTVAVVTFDDQERRQREQRARRGRRSSGPPRARAGSRAPPVAGSGLRGVARHVTDERIRSRGGAPPRSPIRDRGAAPPAPARARRRERAER